MVDLDSDPTKLIDIVEIGKQLLITRGALTTFSVANDLAKYFAILPAMFAALYPSLAALNIMRLATPQSAILSAVIFNALIIVALIPLALRGVRYRPTSAAHAAAPQPADLRRSAASSSRSSASGSSTSRPPHPGNLMRWITLLLRQSGAALRVLLVATVVLGLVYPLAVWGVAPAAGPARLGRGLGRHRARRHARPARSLIGDRPGPGGPGRRPVVPHPPLGVRGGRPRPRRPVDLRRLEPGRVLREAARPGRAAPGRDRRPRGRRPEAGAGRRGHRVGLRASTRTSARPTRDLQVARVARVHRPAEAQVRELVAEATDGRDAGLPRRADGERHPS